MKKIYRAFRNFITYRFILRFYRTPRKFNSGYNWHPARLSVNGHFQRKREAQALAAGSMQIRSGCRAIKGLAGRVRKVEP